MELGQRPIYSAWNGDYNNIQAFSKLQWLTTEKEPLIVLKCLKNSRFSSLVNKPSYRMNTLEYENELKILCSSRDKEHDGV